MFSKVIIWLCYMLVWVNALSIPDSADGDLDLDLAENITELDDGVSTTHVLDKRAITCNGQLWKEGDDPCESRKKEPGWVPCDQPCTYTKDWFISNKIWTPGIDECLFYTGGMSGNARRYSENWNNNRLGPRIVTIWQLWPKRQYNYDATIDNPMRCIIQKDVFPGRRNQLRQDYFEAMSDAMAYMCGGTAIVMESNMAKGGSGYIKRAGIWGNVEFPRLQMEGDGKWNGRVCDRIDAVGPDQADRPAARYWINWWKRGGPVWPEVPTPPEKRALEQRADSPPLNSDVNSDRFDDPSGSWYVDW